MTTKHSPPRDSIAVIYAVLNFLVGKDSESQTSVMYAGNMSYAHQQRMRDRLEKIGMVIVDRQTKRWAITNKGVALRDAIKVVLDMMESPRKYPYTDERYLPL